MKSNSIIIILLFPKFQIPSIKLIPKEISMCVSFNFFFLFFFFFFGLSFLPINSLTTEFNLRERGGVIVRIDEDR